MSFLLQAIVQNDIGELKNAVAKMKANKDVDSDQCLNVCVTLSKYPMTLLALAGYYARSDMVIFLLSPEAGAGTTPFYDNVTITPGC